VLLIEDDAVLGPMIAELLGRDFAITLVDDGREGYRLGLGDSWDAIVIDRGLPGLDGMRVVSALRSQGVATPILMLTALGAVADRIDGLDAGANDYLPKPFDAGELAARLRALTRTFSAAEQVPLVFGDWELSLASRLAHSLHGRSVPLTQRETDLLAAFCAEPERVFSRPELLVLVFEPTDGPGVVDTYVHYLRRKISKDVIRTVHGSGYQLGAGTDD
jgi:two-component system response regulator QseB